jgi:hypothetical protein
MGSAEDNIDVLLNRADKALYEAKGGGGIGFVGWGGWFVDKAVIGSNDFDRQSYQPNAAVELSGKLSFGFPAQRRCVALSHGIR